MELRWILTCNHIVRKLDDYEAILNNGRLFQPRNDPYSDIAFVEDSVQLIDSISLNPTEVSYYYGLEGRLVLVEVRWRRLAEVQPRLELKHQLFH